MNQRCVVFAVFALAFANGPRAVALAADQSSYYLRPSLSLSNVPSDELVKWLRRAGLNLPFSILGNVSFSMTGGVPLTALNDAKAYQFDGNISSPRLRVQNVFVEDFAATVRYRNGVMVLQSVRFRFPKRQNEKAATSFTGRGSLGLVPGGDLELVLSVDSLDLRRISEWTGVDLQLTGTASGSAEVKVANADFSKPANWSGSAKLQATDFKSPGISAPSAEAAFQVANNKLTFDRFAGVVNDVPLGMTGALRLSDDADSVLMDDLRLEIFGGALRVNGRAPVGKLSAQDLSFDAENLDLELLDRQLRPVAERFGIFSLLALQGRISLAFDGRVPFQDLADYSLWRVRRTTIRSPQVLVNGVSFENVQASATFDGVRGSLDPFRWDWPAAASPDGRAGRVEGTIAAQLNLFGRVDLRLQSTHTPMRTLQRLFAINEFLEGYLDGAFSMGAPSFALKTAPTSLATWAAELDLTGEGLRTVDSPLEFRRLTTRWRSPHFEVSNLDFALAGSPISASGVARLADDRSAIQIERAALTTAFGKGSATGSIALNRDLPTRMSVRIENGDAATLSRLLGEDVFIGSGSLNGSLEIAIDASKTSPRYARLNGAFAGVIAGNVQGAIPLGGPDAARRSEGSIDVAVTTPITILERKLTDASIRAAWKGGAFDVARAGFALDGVVVAGKGKVQIDDEVVVGTGVELEILNGGVHGDFRYPLKPTGVGSAKVVVEGLDLAAAKPFLPQRTPRLSGTIDAVASVDFDAVQAQGGPHPMRVKADLASARMTFGNWNVNRTTAVVRTEAGVANFTVRGETLDGVVEWKGVEALDGKHLAAEKEPLTARGSVALRSIHLGRLLAAAPRRRLPDDLVDGRLNASLSYTRSGDKAPTGRGSVEVVNLANRTSQLSRSLTSTVTFDGRRLRFPEVAGDMLDGRLRGTIVLDTQNLSRGAFYRATVEGMSLPRFFPQIGADASLFTGNGDLQVRGRIGAVVTGSGNIEINRGSFAGLELTSWRSPAEIEIDLGEYSGRFVIPQTSALLAQGQVRGNLDYRWDAASRLESTLDFTNVNLRGLLRSTSRLQSFGEGRLSGRLQLGGRSMRSLNDLTGTFSAQLQNTQPGSWPVFDQILTLLTGVGGRALVFDNGAVQGVIGGGGTRFNKIELVSQRARIWGSGTVRHNGGLDMDFTAFTGNTSVRGRGGELLAAQLLANANPTTAVLVRVNQLLSDRVIAVKVSGTISAPVTRIKPGPTLTAEAARFLLAGVVPNPTAPSNGR